MRIAIMQPYFLPYAGYFRLFSETDLFVIYDCVQFLRRGWIHRNRFTSMNNELSWLTLPFVKAPQDILISELAFAEDAKMRMAKQQNKFPIFKLPSYLASEYNDAIMNFTLHPTAYLTHLLKLTCNSLNLPFNVVYSSELQLPSELKGQDRIITIAQHFNAKVYLNAPGGRDLYDEDGFKKHNIKLKFLAEYSGPYESILQRLMKEDIHTLQHEITSQGTD